LKKLGFAATLTLVIGNIIGVGIFTTTGYITTYIDSPYLILLAWIIGALYAISGARVYGILAQAYPLSGGDYQYLKREIHPLAGYIFGWSAFFITYSGSIAALSIAAAHYFTGITNFPDVQFTHTLISLGSVHVEYTHLKTVAILFIFIFSYVTYRGIVLSGKYQIGLTLLVFVLLISFTMAGIFSPKTDYTYLSFTSKEPTVLSGFLVALIAILFSYSGWTTAVYVAEEVENARKTIPRALLQGVLIVGVLYFIINLFYLISVPIEEMKDVINIAYIVFQKIWGERGAVLVSIIILIAIFSSLNSTILSGPRIYQAMGREGLFFGITKNLHKKFSSPHIAIILQMFWSIGLVIFGGFNQLLSFVVFVMIVFSFFAALIAIKIVLHQNKLTGVNLGSIVFYGLFCLIMMINTLIQKPTESLLGIVLLVPAIPFYYFEKIVPIRKN
jgi:APA family basic amino acid/polyamine antiporter